MKWKWSMQAYTCGSIGMPLAHAGTHLFHVVQPGAGEVEEVQHVLLCGDAVLVILPDPVQRAVEVKAGEAPQH
eukprot:9149868-Pyramimonas_sp.AAC.2